MTVRKVQQHIYDYPDSFVLQLLGYMKESLFPSSFRQAEGAVKAHAVNKLPSIPQQYNKQTCVNKLDIKINEKRIGNHITIVLDSNGIKVTSRVEWLPPHKWNVRKGYLKIHMAVDDIKKKKIVSLDVKSKGVHYGSRLRKLITML
jgi:hypothetical protein